MCIIKYKTHAEIISALQDLAKIIWALPSLSTQLNPFYAINPLQPHINDRHYSHACPPPTHTIVKQLSIYPGLLKFVCFNFTVINIHSCELSLMQELLDALMTLYYTAKNTQNSKWILFAVYSYMDLVHSSTYMWNTCQNHQMYKASKRQWTHMSTRNLRSSLTPMSNPH